MIKTIDYLGKKLEYDVEELVKEFKSSYKFKDYDYHSDHVEEPTGYEMSRSGFSEAKKSFVGELESLDSTLLKLCEGLTFTKKGLLAKNRKQILIDSSFILNYSNYWGSHSYKSPCLIAVNSPEDANKIILVIDEYSKQVSF